MTGAAPDFAVIEGSAPPPLDTCEPVAAALLGNSLIMSMTKTRVSLALTPAEEFPVLP